MCLLYQWVLCQLTNDSVVDKLEIRRWIPLWYPDLRACRVSSVVVWWVRNAWHAVVCAVRSFSLLLDVCARLYKTLVFGSYTSTKIRIHFNSDHQRWFWWQRIQILTQCAHFVQVPAETSRQASFACVYSTVPLWCAIRSSNENLKEKNTWRKWTRIRNNLTKK